MKLGATFSSERKTAHKLLLAAVETTRECRRLDYVVSAVYIQLILFANSSIINGISLTRRLSQLFLSRGKRL